MDFDFTTNDRALLKLLGEALGGLDGEALEVPGAELRPAIAALAPTGYLGLGTGGEPVEAGPLLMAAMEAVAARSPSLLLSAEASARLFGRAVATFGDEGQRQRWLGPVQQGAAVGALALSEATTNVVNDPLETRGEREGDLVYVTGEKGPVVNAPIADWIAVVGQLDDGLGLFVIDRGAGGLTVGEPVLMPAYQGVSSAPVVLARCQAATVLGPRPAAELLSTLRGWENQALVGAALGLMKTSFEAARAHAKGHKSGGKPIVAYQEVSFKVAEMLTLYQTSQLLAYRAAWAGEAAEPDAPVLGDCAKVFCCESAEQVASKAMQVLAAAGFVAGHPVERALRSSKLGQIAGTSSEIARVQLGDDALQRWG